MSIWRNFDQQAKFLSNRHALPHTSPNSKMSKPDVVKLILFVSITLHLLAPPCRLRNLSFGRRFFCCRSTNSMYRPSGSQYFLVRICLPCHPHLPSRPSASRLEERTEDTQQLSSPSFTWFYESFIITVVGGRLFGRFTALEVWWYSGAHAPPPCHVST